LNANYPLESPSIRIAALHRIWTKQHPHTIHLHRFSADR
jgi:hypothetical protein